ncbi:Fibronectin type III domain-containing protein [Actinacidiphila alni]|uniref:Alpha-galactosidase n=1 Tax=Actinacidiphila alni TaxID=380248 RepID=A0A1I2IK75_9ACTN|nr:fibronectin type III domain-containing protein [Actinacidiphila alni]SFF40921.1 Fibronectin type III domain-containing protein [Actinacidiphila alni]
MAPPDGTARRGTRTGRTRRGTLLPALLAAGALVAAFAVPAAAATAEHAPAAAPRSAPAAHTPAGHPAGHPAPVLADKPYMGWSSWSLESTNFPGVNPSGSESWLTEAHVKQQADVVAKKLKSHGYEYINVDAGWIGGFDSYGRPLPNTTAFPDGMKGLADYVHAKGLKFGAYLAVGLYFDAYNDGKSPIHGAPGCTTKDIVYPDLRKTSGWDNVSYQMDFSSPCAAKYIDSVADELASWGVDFLKVDGVGPGSGQGDAAHDNIPDVQAWHSALQRAGRPIQLTLSWSLSHDKADVWKQNANGWRVDTDVECYCDTLVTWNNSVKQRWNDVVPWIDDAGPGHWNNLDSLDVGVGVMDGVNDVERQSYATLWAIEAAPLYTGDDLTKLDAYGLKLLTNDEVIAVDQAGNPARPVSQATDQQVWYARDADGGYTVALFNLGGGYADVTADFGDLGISGKAAVRDLWSHKNLGTSKGSFTDNLPPHGSRLLHLTPRATGGAPGVPLAVHGTASTAGSVSLAWDAVTTGKAPVTGYDVYAGGHKATTTSGTTATVTGLSAGTGYTFTVVAHDAKGRRSAPSKAVPVTTPAAGGRVPYEAEAPGNTLGGNASVGDCSACSGGKKVGNLGSGGSVAFTQVNAPKDGTYLLTLDYLDGSSGRTIVVTSGRTSFKLPLPGSNDNNWGLPHSVTVPVHLAAGANTVSFGNPADYASDIDRITV